MIETEMIGFISTVGFPIAITCYVLFRLEKNIKNNTDILTKLTILIEKLIK